MDNENTIECESTVKIAGDVVGKIAAIAALEVEGVSAMGGNITSEILQKVGMKNLMKNVKVEILGSKVNIGVAVTVDYGVSLPGISGAVQQKVKQAVESMTGLTVNTVTVKISGISLTKEK
ncbi:MAG: Asp23/Gls24 family envelope stress response protein [Lachnospiraceae bacterium]|nr:Asp23/Gls24 family envelope stress response protein [Lachnospiraceae bacterium]